MIPLLFNPAKKSYYAISSAMSIVSKLLQRTGLSAIKKDKKRLTRKNKKYTEQMV